MDYTYDEIIDYLQIVRIKIDGFASLCPIRAGDRHFAGYPVVSVAGPILVGMEVGIVSTVFLRGNDLA